MIRQLANMAIETRISIKGKPSNQEIQANLENDLQPQKLGILFADPFPFTAAICE
jgi:hypothetical protein